MGDLWSDGTVAHRLFNGLFHGVQDKNEYLNRGWRLIVNFPQSLRSAGCQSMSNSSLWDITLQAPYEHMCLSCSIVLVNVSHKTWFCNRKFDTVICSPVRLGFIFFCILKLEKHIRDIPSLSGSQAVYGKVYCNLMKIMKVAHNFWPLHVFHSGKKHSLGCIDITVLSKKSQYQ